MPSLSGPISAMGAIIEVRIGIHTARAERLAVSGMGIHSPVHVRALIETGASFTGLDSGVTCSTGATSSTTAREGSSRCPS